MSDFTLTDFLRRMVFAAVIIAVAATCLSPSPRAAETQVPEEYIFSVVMPPQWSIADALIAYQFKGAYYLPIIELAEAYEFFVEAEVDRAFVTGFAGREENSFTIDGERGEIVIKGEREELASNALLPEDSPNVMEGDIYVDLDVLNRIWPVEMRVELSNITIFVEAENEEDLAFVRRKKRQDRRSILESRQELQAQQAPDNLPVAENPYRWISKPILDIQSSYTYNNREKELTGSNNVSGIMHLGKFLADFSAGYAYLRGKLRRPDSIRARFSRQAPDDEDLFIPTLKRVEFGDITLTQRELIGNSASGRGFAFSNTPSVSTREFDRITVEGTGPPGWELELYNNNTLLEFGVIPADGEYRFEDVVLNFGNNRIRVIMYGPQGQVREVVEEYNVAGSLLKPGDFRYRGGFVDTDRPLIPLDKFDNDEDQHVTQNAEYSYGLNRWLTLFGSYTQMPQNGETEKYFTAGAGFGTPIGFGEVEGYRHINGGSAVDVRFLTEILGTRLNLRNTFFSKFESPVAGFGNSAKRYEAEAQINTRLPVPLLPIGLRVNALHREFYDGTVTDDIDTTQSFTGGGLRFGHGTNSRFVNEAHVASSGDFNVNWNKGPWQARGAFNYKIHPEWLLSNGSAELRYATRDAFQAALGLSHNFETSVSGVNAQIGYDFDDILTTFDAGYLQERGWQFIVRATTSINPYHSDRQYKLDSTSKKNVAPVLGRVFLDHDGTGTFTEGDEPVQGARLKVGSGRSYEQTDEEGYVVTALRPDQKNAVRVDEASLLDPYYKSATEGYSVVGLRGTMPGFDFPVVETGAIDGTVWREPSGRPVPGMRLELVNKDGEIYMTTESAYDGYYAFEFVLPGTYTVRADPSYEVNVPDETVTVSSEELFAFGVDLYLLESAAEESAAEEEDGASGGIAQLPTTAPAVPGTAQSAPAYPQDEGRSLIDGETSDEDGAPDAESPAGESSSLVDDGDSIGGVSSVGPSSVTDVRIGESPDEVRLVFDLAGPASYALEEGNGLVVLLDLKNTAWNTVAAHEFAYSKVIESYATEPLAGGGTRVILKARGKMGVKGSELRPAADGQPDRLVVDLRKK